MGQNRRKPVTLGPTGFQDRAEPGFDRGEPLFRNLDSFQEAMKLEVRLFPLQGKKRNPVYRRKRTSFLPNHSKLSLGEEKLSERYQPCHPDIGEDRGTVYLPVPCRYDRICRCLREWRKSSLAFVCGPILLRHPDTFIEQDILTKVKSLPSDKTSLMNTLPEIPIFSERRVQAAADLLFMMANYFSKIDSGSQHRQHEITRQQSLLAEELFLRKIGEPESQDLSSPNLYSRGEFLKERELIDLIKIGDRKRAKVLLDEALGTALFRSREHIGILKARALEIIFVIARAAVEAGANLEEILGFKYQCIQNLSKDDSQETLYYFLMKAFDQLFECIYQNRNIQHTGIFTKAKEYIWGNYNQEISLRKLAEAVGINPYYLSHLFRKGDGDLFSRIPHIGQDVDCQKPSEADDHEHDGRLSRGRVSGPKPFCQGLQEKRRHPSDRIITGLP